MPFSFCLFDMLLYQELNLYYPTYHLSIPDRNINDAILLINIKALSCHNIPTVHQPITPIKCSPKFQGSVPPTDVSAIAMRSITLADHLIYHDKSCCGVIFTFSYLSFVNLVYQIYNQN